MVFGLYLWVYCKRQGYKNFYLYFFSKEFSGFSSYMYIVFLFRCVGGDTCYTLLNMKFVFPAQCVEKTILSPLNKIKALVYKQLTVDVWIYPLISILCKAILVPIPHYFFIAVFKPGNLNFQVIFFNSKSVYTLNLFFIF